MKKIVMIIALGIFAVTGAGFVSGGIASEDKSEDKVEHYEGKDFANADEAKKALIETSEKMAAVAADDNLDVGKMEQIHEISYTTENAVAFLNKKSALDDLAAKLEEVHLSSEDHKADNLRRHFIAYQTELVAYFAGE